MDNNRFSDAEPRANEEEKGRGMMDTRWVVGLDWIGLERQGKARYWIFLSLLRSEKRRENCVRENGGGDKKPFLDDLCVRTVGVHLKEKK